MLNDGTGFKKVYLATGFTDLRKGIDGLARIFRSVVLKTAITSSLASGYNFLKSGILYGFAIGLSVLW